MHYIGNKITEDAAGIQLEFGADGNFIANNTITGVGLGFGTFDASWNSFINNNVTSNGRGLGFNVNSNCNVISDNRITAREWVIALHACHYNNITRNYIANGQIGIYLPDSSDNRVYHNQIVNNVQQASLQGSPSHLNYWDDGCPSGGNYWSDYAGNDLLSGPYQNETGSDGIGDVQRIIDVNNRDSYPLMSPWAPTDIEVSNVVCKTVIGMGFTAQINLTVSNRGSEAKGFNFTAFANQTAMQMQSLFLLGGKSLIAVFTWNTIGFAFGNYTLSAYVEPLPGETNMANNNFTYGTIHVTIPCDFNGDFTVGLADFALLSDAYGSTPTNPKWDPNCDVNDDNKVGPADFAQLSAHYGQHYP